MAKRQTEETLAEVLLKHRVSLDLTQDEYGVRYDVTGPAIFKFEKAQVRPSFRLWIRIAADMGLPFEGPHRLLLEVLSHWP